MRPINKLIIHCADTYAEMDIGVEEIRRWHVEERGWDDIGYHYVIRRDGTIESGRPEKVAGAHARGHNHDSLGICIVGGKGADNNPEFNFTQTQIRSMNALVKVLGDKHENIQVLGHNQVSEKACPCFNVKTYFGEQDERV